MLLSFLLCCKLATRRTFSFRLLLLQVKDATAVRVSDLLMNHARQALPGSSWLLFSLLQPFVYDGGILRNSFQRKDANNNILLISRDLSGASLRVYVRGPCRCVRKDRCLSIITYVSRDQQK